MNNTLRKRVLGAGVVVALAAIILPFLLQGEGYRANRQLAEDVQTRIPPRPPAAASLDTHTPPPPEDVREALIEPEDLAQPVPTPSATSPAVPPAVSAAASKPPVSEPVKAKSVPEVKVKPLDKPIEKPAEKLPTKPIDKPADKPSSKPVDTPAPKLAEKPITPPQVKPLETPAAQTSAVAPAAKTEAWIIQLGSFTAESNAQTLLAQVQRAGVSAKVERIEVKGSPVWRVTSGTYATRAEADAALNVLKSRQNLGGMVRSVR
ncbi:MAG: SPOR domain-containing protein [Halothiobacillaceae bacterium]